MNILVATEQHSGAWNKTSFEALAAGQQIESPRKPAAISRPW
jgi:hypothetical protein